MKIFSNFDTQLDEKLFEKAKEEFGHECVLFVRRDIIYMILKVYIPFILWFLVTFIILALLGGYMSDNGILGTILSRTIWICVIGSLFILSKYCIVKTIDYYMDYTIVTPEGVTQYDQSGLLERGTRALDITKVKTVSVNKKGLLCSIFNYGSIVFFSEGDSDNGDIRLNFISDPIKLRDTISDIVRKGVLLEQKELGEAIANELP